MDSTERNFDGRPNSVEYFLNIYREISRINLNRFIATNIL